MRRISLPKPRPIAYKRKAPYGAFLFLINFVASKEAPIPIPNNGFASDARATPIAMPDVLAISVGLMKLVAAISTFS